jgi:hypothetical protein
MQDCLFHLISARAFNETLDISPIEVRVVTPITNANIQNQTNAASLKITKPMDCFQGI